MGSACGSGHKVAQQDTLILPTRRRTDNAPVASSSHSQLHLQLQTSPPTDDSDVYFAFYQPFFVKPLTVFL